MRASRHTSTLLETERTLPHEVPHWIHQIDRLSAGTRFAGADGYADGYALACAVYGARLPPHAGLLAFAYLWRRFGPPWIGSDDHKTLVAYVLSTPHPDIVLLLNLTASGLEYSTGHGLARAFLASSAAQSVKQALVQAMLTQTLQELLRPIYVRDVAFNLLGLVPDDALVLQVAPAPASPYAGYGIPKSAMDALIGHEEPAP